MAWVEGNVPQTNPKRERGFDGIPRLRFGLVCGTAGVFVVKRKAGKADKEGIRRCRLTMKEFL
jgi:hypothetical protein